MGGAGDPSRAKLRWRAAGRRLAHRAWPALALGGAFALGRWSNRPQPMRPIDSPAIRKATQLEHELDVVESRLAASAGWVMEGQDLRRRHQHVSILQCENAKMQLAITRKMRTAERRKRRRMRQLAAEARADATTPGKTVAGYHEAENGTTAGAPPK